MLPKPINGSLAYQVCPSSSLMAMSEIENVSVYSGNRIRPEGSTVGLHRGCQPSRWYSFLPEPFAELLQLLLREASRDGR